MIPMRLAGQVAPVLLMPLGRAGVRFDGLATDGDEPSPLANDRADLVDRDSAQVMWALLPPVPSSGTTRASDQGGYALIDPADGTYTQAYRGLVMPLSGTPIVYEALITTVVEEEAPTVIAPTITAHPQSVTRNEGQTASFTVAATGTAPLTVEWYRNGSLVAGATGWTYTTAALVPGDTGLSVYSIVRNSAGFATSNPATLTVVPVDATKPILSLPELTLGAPGYLTSAVTTNEGNGRLYVVITPRATKPTEAQVKAGRDETGTLVTAAQSVAVTAVGRVTQQVAHSQAVGSWYAHSMHEDAAGNQSVVATTSALVIEDTEPPELSLPTATVVSGRVVTGTVTTDKGNGTLYWLTTTASGVEATTVITTGRSQLVTAPGVQNIVSSGLTPDTTGYRTYYVHVDENANVSDMASTAAFNTPEAPATGEEFMKVTVPAQVRAPLVPGNTLEGAWIDVTDALDASVLIRIENGPRAPGAAAYCQIDYSPDNGTTVFPAAGGVFRGNVAKRGVYAGRIELPRDTMYMRTVFTGNTGQQVHVQAVVTKVIQA